MNEAMKKIRPYQHGLQETKAYQSWSDMKQRCENKNNKNYKLYGGAGVKICARWKYFLNFYDDMGERPNGHTLDRIDGRKGYSKTNCRWATQREQVLNRRIAYECYRGHPWKPETTVFWKNGKKTSKLCKICLDKRRKKKDETNKRTAR